MEFHGDRTCASSRRVCTETEPWSAMENSSPFRPNPREGRGRSCLSSRGKLERIGCKPEKLLTPPKPRLVQPRWTAMQWRWRPPTQKLRLTSTRTLLESGRNDSRERSFIYTKTSMGRVKGMLSFSLSSNRVGKKA